MSNEIFASIVVGFLTLAVLSVPIFIMQKRHSANKKLKATMYVFGLIWIARFVVGICGSISGESGLTVGESLFDSMIHALQTFSMDEDYTNYTVAGKVLLETAGLPVWANVYGFVISVLNVCAPVLGGALLLDILTGTFPHIKLRLMPYRHKFVFSELNEASITLAEDIYKDDNYKKLLQLKYFEARPVLVFTDAYLDDESEISSELFNRAKALGAVCVKADLLHLNLRKSRSVSYFLIDSESRENISTLSYLLKEKKGGRPLWPENTKGDEPVTKIFVFAQEDVDCTMINSICKNMDENASKVVIRTIRDYMNAAINLMYDVPLFLPLISENGRKAKDLYVTVLGSGQIAEEAFKAAFWCGQIFGVQLHINVVSQNAADLKCRLEEKCPELLESCDADSPILRTHPFDSSEKRNAPYCIAPVFTDVEDVFDSEKYPDGLLEQTNYYIIALGSDEKNLAAADKLRLLLARKMLDGKKADHAVIAPAVFDVNLAEAVRILKPSAFDPYIVPFATLEERFSCKNVFMADFTARALSNEALYNKANQMKAQKDEYTYWANLARDVHAPYKLFGLGMIQKTSSLQKGIRRDFCVDSQSELTEIQEHELAWIEHRRWNAFLRTQGFLCPTKEQYDRYYKLYVEAGNYTMHKSVPLKMHPCLVESQLIPEPFPETEGFDKKKYDCLDFVTMYSYYLESQASGVKATGEGLRQKDYKQWDYRKYDTALNELLS